MLDLLERSRHARDRRLPGRPWPTPISTCSATTPQQHALLKPGYSQAEFDAAYKQDDRRPAPLDDRLPRRPERRHRPRHRLATTRPAATAPPTTPTASSTSSRCAGYWLKDATDRGIQPHLLGRLHVPQRHARKPADVEHDPRHDDQGAGCAWVELSGGQLSVVSSQLRIVASTVRMESSCWWRDFLLVVRWGLEPPRPFLWVGKSPLRMQGWRFFAWRGFGRNRLSGAIG